MEKFAAHKNKNMLRIINILLPVDDAKLAEQLLPMIEVKEYRPRYSRT